MTSQERLEAVAQAPAAELPALAMALAARLAQAATPTLPAPAPRADPITPERAAAIAQVAVKTIYEWARGKAWALRPSKRSLRIDEAGFRAWLAGRAAP